MNNEPNPNHSSNSHEVSTEELNSLARQAYEMFDHPTATRTLSPDETLIDADGQTVTVRQLSIDDIATDQPSLLRALDVDWFGMSDTPACYERGSDMHYPEMISIAYGKHDQEEPTSFMVNITDGQATITTDSDQSMLIGFDSETGQLADPLGGDEGVQDVFLPDSRPINQRDAQQMRTVLQAVAEYLD